jgi:hypothetical protein
MSNILKTIDLTDRAIRRAVFAVLDGLAAEHRAATTACRSVALPALRQCDAAVPASAAKCAD